MKQTGIFLLLLLLISCSTPAQHRDYTTLRLKFRQILAQYEATAGVAVIDIASGDTVTYNNHIDFPTQSVYKFPLALNVLDQVDKGKLKLNQQVDISKELAEKFKWSPLKRQHKGEIKSMSLDSLIMYMIAYSDNLSCDVLFNLTGGPMATDDFIRSKGIEDIHIRKTELEIGMDYANVFRNTSSPYAMSLLLQKFNNGTVVSAKSRDYLLNYMVNDSTSSARLRGMLPKDVIVAHKTGTAASDTLVSACNDVGIFTLPDKRKLAVSVFVMNAKLSYEETEKLIARLSYEVYKVFKE